MYRVRKKTIKKIFLRVSTKVPYPGLEKRSVGRKGLRRSRVVGSVSNLWRPVVREMRAITVPPPSDYASTRRHLTRPFNKN